MANETFVSLTNRFYTRNDNILAYVPPRWIIPQVGLYYPAMMGDDAIIDVVQEHDKLKEYCTERSLPMPVRGFLIIPDKKRIVKIVYTEADGLVYDSFDMKHHSFIALAPFGDIEAFLSTTRYILEEKYCQGEMLLEEMEVSIEGNMLKADNVYQERISWNVLSQLVENPLLEVQCTEKIWALV